MTASADRQPVPATPDPQRFAYLGRPRAVWAIGAAHGDAGRLAALHDHIAPRFRAGERMIYLGNFLGRGAHVRETVEEMLAFRRGLLAQPGLLAEDVVYLRGQQEEMWQKLMQLQFAPNPAEVLGWMLDQGVGATLEAYGGSPREAMVAAREGAVQVTRWTNRLRKAVNDAEHNRLLAALRRAALSDPVPPAEGAAAAAEAAAEAPADTGAEAGAGVRTIAAGEGGVARPDHADRDLAGDQGLGLLFVSGGLDPSRPLAAQTDSFWWDARGFDSIDAPYEAFGRIVRGFDPKNRGVVVEAVIATLDGGCGRGGSLVAGCFAPDGTVLDLVEV
ncbi:MAG: hypothetical protein RID91_20720 [Azospirillaceae bacterium]